MQGKINGPSLIPSKQQIMTKGSWHIHVLCPLGGTALRKGFPCCLLEFPIRIQLGIRMAKLVDTSFTDACFFLSHSPQPYR